MSGGHKKAQSKPLFDTFIKWLFGVFLKNLLHLLKRAAIFAVMIGLLGYTLSEFRKNGVDILQLIFHSDNLTPIQQSPR